MNPFYDYFDLCVVGGGHAGLEASVASAKAGLKTLLITQSIDAIARMSCNPSIGGIAKGNIVHEIDALGGVMGRLIDKALIQYKMLNKSRGPAVQAPRAQADKALYSQLARALVEDTPNLYTLMDTVTEVLTVLSSSPLPPSSTSLAEGKIPGEYTGHLQDDNKRMRRKVVGIKTERGRVIPCRAVVLTTGTFLGGKIFIGDYDAPCGRLGEQAAIGLTSSLQSLGFSTGRLKTGTPARILKKSINFDLLTINPGDKDIIPFSFSDKVVERPIVPCYIAYTNERTHEIIRKNIGRSPLYSGKISGIGPRYCPSIEDKVMRFSNRTRHQIFIEPEGLTTSEIYLNGLSSSLPESVQLEFIRTMAGFEAAVASRPGYAVEYDYIEPTQLYPSLETKRVAGLFNAGQINGTSGYEEAAGQGLIAGINASKYAKEHKILCEGFKENKEKTGFLCESVRENITIPSYTPLILGRNEAYIGVLIDDLVTLGTTEPYRMFTARAEYRLKLRYDTADIRLIKYAKEAGLKSSGEVQEVLEKYERLKEIEEELEKDPSYSSSDIDTRLLETARINLKYRNYIEKQDKRIVKMHKMENLRIPPSFNYSSLSLSSESRAKLEKVRPLTLGQASRISGIRNSDLMLLMVYLK